MSEEEQKSRKRKISGQASTTELGEENGVTRGGGMGKKNCQVTAKRGAHCEEDRGKTMRNKKKKKITIYGGVGLLHRQSQKESKVV